MNRSVERMSNSTLREVAGKVDAVSLAREIVQGWLRRLNGKQRKRELDICYERRLERMRIAGELHDTLLQGFLGASIILGATLEEIAEDSPARASLSRAAELMQRAIDEGRAVLQGLRFSPVAFESLEREFSDLLREALPTHGVQARILVIGQPRALKPEIQHEIYLIGREALVNALHHSTAARIEVEIAYLRRNLRVMVRDNGCGIDERIERSRRACHWGLLRMRERAEAIGAEIRIYSRRGAGTEVEISVPTSIATTA